MAAILQFRQGSKASFISSGPYISEPFFDTDTNIIHIGVSGSSTITLTKLEDINSGSFSVSGDISGSNLYLSGDLTASNTLLSGDITIGGNIILGDQVQDNITVSGQFDSDLIPSASATYNLGSITKKWNHLYALSASIDSVDLVSNLPTGTISSSFQVYYYDIADRPSLDNYNSWTANADNLNGIGITSGNTLYFEGGDGISTEARNPGNLYVTITLDTGSNHFISGAQTASLLGLPQGTVSSSQQVIDFLPSGVISGSTQVIELLPTNTVSGSVQVLGGTNIVSSSQQVINFLPQGTVSGSSQVLDVLTQVNSFTSSQESKNTTLATYTGSVDTSISSLNSFTNSFDTAISLNSSDVTILGNLTVQGTQTQLNTSTLNVEDKNILLASGAADSSAADGAGITIDGVDKSLQWEHSTTQFVFDAQVSSSVGFKGDGSNLTGLTADSVEYDNILNKPTLISSSAQLEGETLGTLTPVSVTGSFHVTSTILPDANEVYDLGSPTRRFRDFYISSGSLRIGNATISSPDNGITTRFSGGRIQIGGLTGPRIISRTNGGVKFVGPTNDEPVPVVASRVILTGSAGEVNLEIGIDGALSSSTVSGEAVLGNYTGSFVGDGSGLTNINTNQFTSSLDTRYLEINGDNVLSSSNENFSDYSQSVDTRLLDTLSSGSDVSQSLYVLVGNFPTSGSLGTAAFYNVSSSLADDPNVIPNVKAVYDYINNTIGAADITGVSASLGLSGGGASGYVSLSLDTASAHFQNAVQSAQSYYGGWYADATNGSQQDISSGETLYFRGNGVTGDISTSITQLLGINYIEFQINTGSAHFLGGVAAAGAPQGTVSSSQQVIDLLPSGTISGSSQVSYVGLSNIPQGIVSGSPQTLDHLESSTLVGINISNPTSYGADGELQINGTTNGYSGILQLLSGSNSVYVNYVTETDKIVNFQAEAGYGLQFIPDNNSTKSWVIDTDGDLVGQGTNDVYAQYLFGDIKDSTLVTASIEDREIVFKNTSDKLEGSSIYTVPSTATIAINDSTPNTAGANGELIINGTTSGYSGILTQDMAGTTVYSQYATSGDGLINFLGTAGYGLFLQADGNSSKAWAIDTDGDLVAQGNLDVYAQDFRATGDISGSGLYLTSNIQLGGNLIVGSSTITPTEFSYLDGVTSDIQTQINSLTGGTGSYVDLSSPQTISGIKTFNDIVVNGTGSFAYIESVSGTAKIIGDAFIILNNDTPTERYAGIAVYDSGSVNTTASLQFDGQTNDWFYEYSDDGGVTTDHGVVLFGPEYSGIGNPTYPTNNRVQKGNGGHHLLDSNITDTGTLITLGSNTNVSGVLTATTISGMISGSSQVNADSITNFDSNVLAYNNSLGVISGSSQVTLAGDVTGAGNATTVGKIQGIAITADEATQLANIGTTTISTTQWGYIGVMDQNVRTTDDVTFGSIDVNGSVDIRATSPTLLIRNTDTTVINNQVLGEIKFLHSDANGGLAEVGVIKSVSTQEFTGVGNTGHKIHIDAATIVNSTLEATGDVIAYSSSDRRLKDEIEPISDPISKINSIGGYSFVWNSEKQNIYNGKDYGVIAQEIEEILPELVQTRENGYKAVKYDKLVSLLIEGIKELSKEVQELKKKIN